MNFVLLFLEEILDLPASGPLSFRCLCQRYKCTTLAHSFHLWPWTEAKWPLTFSWAIECILCECVHSIQRTSTAKHFEPTVVSKISGSQNDQAFGTKVLFLSESASRGAIKQTKFPGFISSGPQECNKLLETDNSAEPVHHQNGTKRGSSANDAERLSALITFQVFNKDCW